MCNGVPIQRYLYFRMLSNFIQQFFINAAILEILFIMQLTLSCKFPCFNSSVLVDFMPALLQQLSLLGSLNQCVGVISLQENENLVFELSRQEIITTLLRF